MTVPDLSTREGRERLRSLAENPGTEYQRITLEPGSVLALLDTLDTAEAALQRVRDIVDRRGAVHPDVLLEQLDGD